MHDLARLVDGQPVTDSGIISDGTGNNHKAVIQLVRTYADDLSEFGRVTFQMAPFETAGGQQNRTVAILNERHATLLMTYMRNTARVREFKKALVRAFFTLVDRAKIADPMDVLRDPVQVRQLLSSYASRVESLERARSDQRMQARAFVMMTKENNLVLTIEAVARALGVGYEELCRFLEEKGWIFRTDPMGPWQPSKAWIKSGHLGLHSEMVTWQRGLLSLCERVRILPQGFHDLSLMVAESIGC